jgi:hypothetical protein
MGPQRERTLQRRNGFPRETGRGVSSSRAHSRKGEGQWASMKATGQCSRRLLRRMGGGTMRMVDDPKQGRSRERKATDASREARSGVFARLADRVVVAMMPRDNITLAEQRTRGAAACLMTRRRTRHAQHSAEPTGDPRRVAKSGTYDAPNPLAGKGASERTCGRAALKPYWGKPAVRNFRGV